MNEVVDIVTEEEEPENIRASLIWMNSWSEEEKPPEDWTDLVDNQSDNDTIPISWRVENESSPVEFESPDKHGTGSGSIKEIIQIDGKHCETEEEQTKMQDPNLIKMDKTNKFRFKQKPLTVYFKDRRVMELDKEIEILNKEMLKEKQRMLLFEWKERRILMEAAKSTLEDLLTWTLEEVGRRESTRRAERVMKAKLLSSPAKRKCEGEHKELTTPSKRRRNRRAGGDGREREKPSQVIFHL